MNLRQLLHKLTPTERENLADECGTTVEYFWQIAGGHRKPGPLLARKIEQHSSGKVTAMELRPDIFGNLNQNDTAA
jgi:DNA-binding transcriptional regulator YdaS (Cro superfamily)